MNDFGNYVILCYECDQIKENTFKKYARRLYLTQVASGSLICLNFFTCQFVNLHSKLLKSHLTRHIHRGDFLLPQIPPLSQQALLILA